MTLTLLNYQNYIDGVKVIVSDSSDDGTTYQLESRNQDHFNLHITEGGLPAKARNNGAKLVETPYVLFMDSDMFLLDPELLNDVVNEMRLHKLELLTTKVRTTNGKYDYVFKTFDIIQRISKSFSPFCLGGFMLFRTKTFYRLGGFNEEAKVAEDYLLSKQVTPKKI